MADARAAREQRCSAGSVAAGCSTSGASPGRRRAWCGGEALARSKQRETTVWARATRMRHATPIPPFRQAMCILHIRLLAHFSVVPTPCHARSL